MKKDSLEDLFKERLRAELACVECGIDVSLKVEVKEDLLDGAFKMSLSELSSPLERDLRLSAVTRLLVASTAATATTLPRVQILTHTLR